MTLIATPPGPPVATRKPASLSCRQRLLALLALLLTGAAGAQSPETWQVAPWVKQTQLAAGLKGGEGGQWPRPLP